MGRVLQPAGNAPEPVRRIRRPWARSARSAWLASLVLLGALAATALLISGHRGSAVSPSLQYARHRLAAGGLVDLPAAARAPVSAALGYGSRAYRVTRSSGGFQLVNPTQRLSARFRRSGVQVASRGARLGLRLAAFGEGGQLMALGAATPVARGNRVSYVHPWLSEWYANGPLGLEQGFTIGRRPAGPATGQLMLAIAVSGNMRATLARSGGSVELSRRGRILLRYTGLSASDARGHALPSWLSVRDGVILVHVDTAGARYPVEVDPLVQQGSKLVDTETTWPGNFGVVALSSDGQTALIGAPQDDFGGAAYVFTRTGSTWTQEAKLTAAGEAGASIAFGASVALSGNGSVALVGAPGYGPRTGAAWVFTRSGTTWSEGPKLTAGAPESEGGFGWSVALSGDGKTALVGSPDEDSGTYPHVVYEAGAAYVFARSGKTWVQQGGKLTGAEEAYPEGYAVTLGVRFASSVALSKDGNTALIGGPWDNEYRGAAWIFDRSDGTWAQDGKKLTDEQSDSGGFGESGALSSDGRTALIGAPGEDGYAGAAWVFGLGTTGWSEQAKLTGNARESAYFGSSLALSSNGSTALVGAPVEESYVGSAWLFTRSGAAWSQGESILADEESGEGRFGSGVALSGEANIALIGAPLDDNGNGAVWTFVPGQHQRPALTQEAALNITANEATVQATVDPHGSEISECSFEYGTTPGYGSSVPCSPQPGAVETRISGSLTGLSPDTTYYFRASAANGSGTSHGQESTFTTLPAPPAVETLAPTEIWQSEATLEASVNPNGNEITTCTFEYGTTSEYGSKAPCSWLPGAGHSAVDVSAPVNGLKAGTEYHVRILAASSAGSSTSSGLTFKTLPTPPMSSSSATVVGEPGSYIGDGQDRLFDAPGAVTASAGEEGGRVEAQAEYHNERFSFRFAARRGEHLEDGEYVRAERFGSKSSPGIEISGDGSGCNETFGRFVVKDIELGPSGRVERFWALYEQHCERRESPALFGEVRIGEPPTQAPEIVQPAAVEWPRTEVGATSVEVPVTVGGGEVGADVTSVALEGEDAGDFGITSDDCQGVALAPDERCQVAIDTTPTASGVRTATLVVTDRSGARTGVPLRVDTELPPEAPVSTDFATMVSQRESFLGAGEDWLFDAPYAVSMSGEPHSVFVEAESGGSNFTFLFAAPGAQPLRVGQYRRAESYPVESKRAAVLSVSGGGRGCSRNTGRFRIKDLQLGPSDQMERFWALYEVHCGGLGAPPVFGEIELGEPSTNAPELVQPNAVEWPPTPVGASTVEVPITIAAGEAGARIESVSLRGGSGEFTVVRDGCDGVTLSPAARCQLTVATTPATIGHHAAKLLIADASGATTVVPLSVRAESP